MGFDLSRPAEVSFSVIDAEGEEVRRLVDDRQLAGDTKHRFRWDGRDDEGAVVPDGIYRLRVVRRKEGRVVDSFKEVRRGHDAAQGQRSTSAEPRDRGPGRRPVSRCGCATPARRTPRPSSGCTARRAGPVRIVRRFRGDGTRSGVWDGA